VLQDISEKGSESLLWLLDKRGVHVPDVLRQALEKGSEGMSKDDVIAAAEDLLNDDAVVDKTKKLAEQGSTVMQSLDKFGKSEAMRHAMAFVDAAMESEAVEKHLMKQLDEFDPEEQVQLMEAALTSNDAREKMVNKMKDDLLDFITNVLPSIKVPPLDGEKPEFKYSVHNLDMSRIKLKKENVRIQLSDVLGKVNPIDRLRRRRDKKKKRLERGVEIKDERGNRHLGGDVVLIELWDLSAKFLGTQVTIEQSRFPYLQGGGTLDASSTGLSILLGFGIADCEDEDKPPSLECTRIEIEMETFDLWVGEQSSRLAWLYNTLTAALNPLIRRYVRGYLEYALTENMDWLLGQLNWAFQQAWPYLSTVVPKPKVEGALSDEEDSAPEPESSDDLD